MPLKLGTVSYNIHANFTNYGSALQTWALHQAIRRSGDYDPVLIDYCPDCLADKDPLDPMRNMWDADEESRRLCELSLPAIRENALKFDDFYSHKLNRSQGVYTSSNFDEVVSLDGVSRFVCGSDTIFCPDEFGIDDGYYANYPCMRGRSVAYAPSFGDPHFKDDELSVLDERLGNFCALGLREDLMVPYVCERTEVPVARVVDPTLLLEAIDYESIIAPSQEESDYLLLYSRRYNPIMEAYAEKVAADRGWKVIEISLRAENASRHRMFYEAGVEEFLSLVKRARFVVTNSFHGMIFAFQFKVPFYVFSREQCSTKITELLSLMGLSERLVVTAPRAGAELEGISWAEAHSRMERERDSSMAFLKMELDLLSDMEESD